MLPARRPTRRAPFILPLLALPALIGCGARQPDAPSPAAQAAVIAAPGVPREGLVRAVDRLFTDRAIGDTHAVLVLRDGKPIAERYAAPYTTRTRFPGWSITKCVTGLMIGLLVTDGRLRLDAPVPVPAWQRTGDPRGEITLRELLQMRSGLRNSERADPSYGADTVRMLYLDGRDDMAAYAEAQPLAAEPGSRFDYSTGTSVILADLAARTLSESTDPAARRRAVADYLRSRLFEPLHAASMQPEFDSAGTFIGGTMLHATTRDWGKLGEFLRNGGAVHGGQVVPRAWVAFMTAPSPRNPAYGAQLWLNRPSKVSEAKLFPRRAPADLFACVGEQGQYVIASPSQHLTLVRLGKTDDDAGAELRGRLAELVALFPVRS